MSLRLGQVENVGQAARVRRRRGYRYQWKCNFIYTHKKSVTFSVQIFTKLMKATQCYVEIFYTKFYFTNWTTSIQHTNINSCMSISKLRLSLHIFSWNSSWNKFLGTTPALCLIQIIHKIQKTWQIFIHYQK
jgi:hypothetical protein